MEACTLPLPELCHAERLAGICSCSLLEQSFDQQRWIRRTCLTQSPWYAVVMAITLPWVGSAPCFRALWPVERSIISALFSQWTAGSSLDFFSRAEKLFTLSKWLLNARSSTWQTICSITLSPHRKQILSLSCWKIWILLWARLNRVEKKEIESSDRMILDPPYL